jgi:hypothetical protein
MRTIKIGKVIPTKIELYDSIKEMPITRHNELQKLIVMNHGIGSTIEDYNNHFGKVHAYLQADKKDDAINEMTNLFKNYFAIINELGFWSYPILAYVHSIDGKEFDINEDRLKEDMLMLSKKGLTVADVESQIGELKKKLMTNCSHHFLADLMTLEVPTY